MTAPGRRSIRVGISVSEPAGAELIRLGLSELHVRHAFIELVRHVLASGSSIAYGGDFRKAGYTEALFDLVRTYNPKDLSGPDRVSSYVAWPLWLDLTPADRAEIANVANLVEVGPPEGAPAMLAPSERRTSAELLWNSRALLAMREAMTADIHARIVLGGRLAGQQGLYPGVLQEAALALLAGVPLFVAGGFGGCGHVIAGALRGAEQLELTIEYQSEHTGRYEELLGAAQDAGLAPDFLTLSDTFASAGMSGLHNGLDEADNHRLAETDDVDEVVALVMRGLRQI